MSRIAIVGMACRFPEATAPSDLWHNALTARRAFRRLPDVRMRLDDYWDPDPTAPDRFYARNAAVIEGYSFDRVAHKVAGSTYRSADPTHWLALDTAGAALADAGFPQAEGLPRQRTAVVVGNTLTGEFVRANTLRLRWPYVRRVLAAALKEQDWDDQRLAEFLAGVEETYKRPFPAVDEDSLAGGLSNTIAGRICNHFDLNGGGFTVDGACSSSLLSVTQAARALLEGDVDVAVAGGVDLSIDPFEIIGFAKTGALAKAEMRVYDRASNGFWPGEGCGMVVLMREADALAAGHRCYATIAGWGISSDGHGGITRPEADGYRLALKRAYEKAGFGVESVPLFEGHGTGTAVGDATELRALGEARAAAGATGTPAVISSVKAMIGHTKAAAGVAGLIKAAMAVDAQVLPPTLGCVDPHPLLTADGATLRALRAAEPWTPGAPVRAGVTAMGFGGINTHLVLDQPGGDAPRRRRPADGVRALARSAQDVELLLVAAPTPGDLRRRLGELAAFVITLSYGQLADLAATLRQELREARYRAAVVASSPEDAELQLLRLDQELGAGRTRLVEPDGGAYLGRVDGPGRIGYLFPGQGSGRGTSGGALRRRFTEAAEVYDTAGLPGTGDMVATEVAQPRIVTGSVAGLRTLEALGLEARVAVGHSLGEITALHWAGALDATALLRVARTRGSTMSEHAASGTMASLAASPERAAGLSTGLPVVIAAYNGPGRTVLAGPVDALEAVRSAAAREGVPYTALAVSHAFHSPLVAPAADRFAERLAAEEFRAVARRVISTVTGDELAPDTDIRRLLRRQITDPVRFAQAVGHAAPDVDLFVEVGPGRVLGPLAETIADVPALSLDTDDESLRPLLRVAGAAFVAGAPLRHERLFADRTVRPLRVGTEFRFFANPCEQAPTVRLQGKHSGDRPAQGTGQAVTAVAHPDGPEPAVDAPGGPPAAGSGTDVLRRLIAERAELPLELVGEDTTLLDDLHLSSITVGQIVNQAAQRLGVPAAQAPVNFATATVSQLSAALEELAALTASGDGLPPAAVTGAAGWVRPFAVHLDEEPLPVPAVREPDGPWTVSAPDGHPFAEELRHRLEQAAVGPGTLVCLPPDCSPSHLEPALAAAQRAAVGGKGLRFVLVQHDRGAAALAKTLRLEAPQLRVTIVRIPRTTARVTDLVTAEVAATTGFAEVYYDTAGVRRVPTLRALPPAQRRSRQPLDDTDVLLVSGGGKGITAECALALAADSGARLAILGRSDPAEDEELAAGLRRMADRGVRVRYARADVCDPDAVRAAVAELTGALGTVTAVLHGAGRNEPMALTGLDPRALRQALAPKVDGLRAVLDAVGTDRLRLLVTFGSIIGRAGLRGEAHYATANEWLADLTEEVARRSPSCRTLCLEWSVWSGVGMGERLSVLETLAREGITPVSPDQGVALLRRLVSDPDAPSTVVVSGRTGDIDTVRHDRPRLPLLRFVGRPLVHYHGVELVTETELNAGTDPYLADHFLDRNLLFPAVLGMEAMAQAAAAVTGRTTAPVLEDVRFPRPIVVPPGGSTRIRVAAVVTGENTVEAVIHCAETDFAAEHFAARLVFTEEPVPAGPPGPVPDGLPHVALDPATELYGDLLFQSGRFRRLTGYRQAAARRVDATVSTATAKWFADFLPDELLLGDPGMRDALMHGNQVCVPDATLLPHGIERLYPCGGKPADAGELVFSATERHHEGNSYLYDIAVRTADGRVVERWEGLRLHAVRRTGGAGPWASALIAPFLERELEDVLGVVLSVGVEPVPAGATRGTGRRARTAVAVGRALGHPAHVRYRPDGRPEIDGNRNVSAAHGPGLTLAVVTDAASEGSPAAVACDIEEIRARPSAAWQALLGHHAQVATLVARERGEDADTAATRVWSAVECLQKAGITAHAPLTLGPAGRDGWAVFTSGSVRVATLVTTVRDAPTPVVLAVLTEGQLRT